MGLPQWTLPTKEDTLRTLEQGVPQGADTASPVYFPPKTSVQDTSNCGQVGDRSLRNGYPLPERAQDPAQLSNQTILAALKSLPLPGGRPLECAECGVVFTWVTHFIEPQKGHCREVLFPCPECSKGFLHASVLAEHRKIHRLEPPGKKAHPGEGPGAKPQGLLAKSLQPRNGHENPSGHGTPSPASHSPEQPFQCSVCSKAFPWMAHLVDHQKLHVAP
ncbi:LOW QUALITY PROTEIN: zinc finger and SCAN domain-containing protein 1 [Trichechus inunguis]